MGNPRVGGENQNHEGMAVRRKAVSPPVSPVTREHDEKEAQRFTAKQHGSAAEDARVVSVAPTPTSVVMLRRHFSKQRQAHERDARDTVAPCLSDPLVFVKQAVSCSGTRRTPSSTGCLASTRGRRLHFFLLDQHLQAAQRRLALALVGGNRAFHLDNTCCQLLLAALLSTQGDGWASVGESNPQAAEATQLAVRPDERPPHNERPPHTERAKEGQIVGDHGSHAGPNQSEMLMAAPSDRALPLP